MGAEDILFLDDSVERHRTFTNSAPLWEFRVFHSYTAAAAIEKIEAHRPVQVFLDHDLSEDDVMCVPGQPTRVPTGMTVVEHIMTMREPPTDVIIHSCNGPASEAMEARLREHPAGIRVRRIPFPSLIRSLHEANGRKSR